MGIVTIPFLFEGEPKILQAFAGVEEMRKHVDALLVINNERLCKIYPDENALFYMRSRGINEKEARLLLMFAFVNEVIDTIRLDAVSYTHLDVYKRQADDNVMPQKKEAINHAMAAGVQMCIRDSIDCM